jgi:putative ABC transport system permease protein
MGLAPAAGIGVRMALEPRSGRASVPVRSSLIGAGVAVLGLVAVSVFGASLQHLHDTPAAFGRPWDVRVVDTRAAPQRHGHICGGARTRLQHDPDVAAIASACTVDIELNGRAIGAFGMTPVLGSIAPTVLRGRAPTRSDEIALGTHTSSALGVRIGDRVTGRTRSGAVEYRVVGQVAVPALSDPQAVADGAVLTGAGLDRLTSPKTNFGTPDLLVRFRPGVDKTAVAARIRRMPGIGGFERPGVTAVNVPLEVERIDQIHRMPLVLGAFLALVGAIAVGHLLVTSVRHRRRDFAVLKAIGFTSRQVFAAVSWQATTVAIAGLLVGLGLGLLGGSLMWRAVAHQVGVLPTVEIPLPVLVTVAAATIAGVNAVAAIPARAAARTQAAATLRSE